MTTILIMSLLTGAVSAGVATLGRAPRRHIMVNGRGVR